MKKRDAFLELRTKIRNELARHPETSGGQILEMLNDPDTGDLLVTAQYASGQRTHRLVIMDDEEDDVPRETSPSVEDKFPFRVDATYQVNAGAWRTAQRTVQARDVQEAGDLVRAQLAAVFRDDRVFFGRFDISAVPDGGPVVRST